MLMMMKNKTERAREKKEERGMRTRKATRRERHHSRARGRSAGPPRRGVLFFTWPCSTTPGSSASLAQNPPPPAGSSRFASCSSRSSPRAARPPSPSLSRVETRGCSPLPWLRCSPIRRSGGVAKGARDQHTPTHSHCLPHRIRHTVCTPTHAGAQCATAGGRRTWCRPWKPQTGWRATGAALLLLSARSYSLLGTTPPRALPSTTGSSVLAPTTLLAAGFASPRVRGPPTRRGGGVRTSTRSSAPRPSSTRRYGFSSTRGRSAWRPAASSRLSKRSSPTCSTGATRPRHSAGGHCASGTASTRRGTTFTPRSPRRTLTGKPRSGSVSSPSTLRGSLPRRWRRASTPGLGTRSTLTLSGASLSSWLAPWRSGLDAIMMATTNSTGYQESSHSGLEKRSSSNGRAPLLCVFSSHPSLQRRSPGPCPCPKSSSGASRGS